MPTHQDADGEDDKHSVHSRQAPASKPAHVNIKISNDLRTKQLQQTQHLLSHMPRLHQFLAHHPHLTPVTVTEFLAYDEQTVAVLGEGCFGKVEAVSARIPGERRVHVRHLAHKKCTLPTPHRIAAEVDAEATYLLQLHAHFDALRFTLSQLALPMRAPFPSVVCLHAQLSENAPPEQAWVGGFCMERSDCCLEDKLQQGLSLGDVLRVAHGLAGALHVVHTQRVPGGQRRAAGAGHYGGIHCDVKPRNTLLRWNNTTGHLEHPILTRRGAKGVWSTEPVVQLSDVGLSKGPSAQPHRHTHKFGTMAYLPHQLALSNLWRQGADVQEHLLALPPGSAAPPVGRDLLLGPHVDLHALGVSMWDTVCPDFSTYDCNEIMRETVRGTAHATGDPAALPTRGARPVVALAMLLSSGGMDTAAKVVKLVTEMLVDCLIGGRWADVETAAVRGDEWPTGAMAVGYLVTRARTEYTQARRGSARDRVVADAAYLRPGEILHHHSAGDLYTGGAVPAPQEKYDFRRLIERAREVRRARSIGMVRRVLWRRHVRAGLGLAMTLTWPMMQALGIVLPLLPMLLAWGRREREAEPAWVADLLGGDSSDGRAQLDLTPPSAPDLVFSGAGFIPGPTLSYARWDPAPMAMPGLRALDPVWGLPGPAAGHVWGAGPYAHACAWPGAAAAGTAGVRRITAEGEVAIRAWTPLSRDGAGDFTALPHNAGPWLAISAGDGGVAPGHASGGSDCTSDCASEASMPDEIPEHASEELMDAPAPAPADASGGAGLAEPDVPCLEPASAGSRYCSGLFDIAVDSQAEHISGSPKSSLSASGSSSSESSWFLSEPSGSHKACVPATEAGADEGQGGAAAEAGATEERVSFGGYIGLEESDSPKVTEAQEEAEERISACTFTWPSSTADDSGRLIPSCPGAAPSCGGEAVDAAARPSRSTCCFSEYKPSLAEGLVKGEEADEALAEMLAVENAPESKRGVMWRMKRALCFGGMARAGSCPGVDVKACGEMLACPGQGVREVKPRRAARVLGRLLGCRGLRVQE